MNVNDNQLKNLQGITKCSNLTELYANNNQLSSLQDLKGLKSLKILTLAYNSITDLSELQYLRRSLSLKLIRVLGNPICIAKDHLATILQIVPKVKIIEFGEAEVDIYLT